MHNAWPGENGPSRHPAGGKIMKVKTQVKAGGLNCNNHNQTLVRAKAR
jgi:hypothetical protein